MKSKPCAKCGKTKRYGKDTSKSEFARRLDEWSYICKVCDNKRRKAERVARAKYGNGMSINRPRTLEFPERELLCAIIGQAVTEWQVAAEPMKRIELTRFFIGPWFYDLCLLLDLEPNVILKGIGIGFRFKVPAKPPINEDQVYA